MVLAQEDGGLDLSVLEGETIPLVEPNVSPIDSEETTTNDKNPNGSIANSSPSEGTRFLDLLMATGWIGAVLFTGSIVAVTLVIRLCFQLRRSAFMPSELLQASSDALSCGDVKRATELVSTSASFFGQVMTAGLRESDRGWTATEKALEDAVASLTAKLYRQAEPLSVIGNVAPMLGLLGTVMGMVSTFGELAVTDGSGRNLANGIYFALVTTVAGLLVAIPVLVAHSLINARVGTLVSETSDAVEHSLEPIKRGVLNAPQTVPQRHSSSPPSHVLLGSASGQPLSGLQELPKEPEKHQGKTIDGVKQSTAGRPALSLKTRRSE